MATNILDTFNGDAFNIVALTAAIQDVPHTPNLLGSLGLFHAEGITTTDAAIEVEDGTLTVIPTSPRGSAPSQATGTRRKVRKVEVAHIARETVVYADSVQGVRAFGSGDPQNIEALLMARFSGPFGLRAQIELTMEHHRLGAIDGAVMDADGTSVLWDWFSFFDVPRPATVDVDFGALTADGSDFELQCTSLIRAATTALGGLVLTGMQPVALCGDNFYDAVLGNKEVKTARRNRDTGKDGDIFGASLAFRRISFGGITWLNYQSGPDGKVAVPSDEARLFPAGVPGLFQVFFSPADVWEAANSPGLPLYALQRRERQTESARVFEVQSNPLHLCSRPRALRRLRIKP